MAELANSPQNLYTFCSIPKDFISNLVYETKSEAEIITDINIMSRLKILSIYKRILRVGQNWTAINPDNTQVSLYI